MIMLSASSSRIQFVYLRYYRLQFQPYSTHFFSTFSFISLSFITSYTRLSITNTFTIRQSISLSINKCLTFFNFSKASQGTYLLINTLSNINILAIISKSQLYKLIHFFILSIASTKDASTSAFFMHFRIVRLRMSLNSLNDSHCDAYSSFLLIYLKKDVGDSYTGSSMLLKEVWVIKLRIKNVPVRVIFFVFIITYQDVLNLILQLTNQKVNEDKKQKNKKQGVKILPDETSISLLIQWSNFLPVENLELLPELIMPAKGFLLELLLELKLEVNCTRSCLSYLSFLLSDTSVVILFFLLLPVIWVVFANEEFRLAYFSLQGMFSISNRRFYSLYYDQSDDILILSLPAMSLLIFNSALLIVSALGTYFLIILASLSNSSIRLHFGIDSNRFLSQDILSSISMSYLRYSSINLTQSSSLKYLTICSFFFSSMDCVCWKFYSICSSIFYTFLRRYYCLCWDCFNLSYISSILGSMVNFSKSTSKRGRISSSGCIVCC